MEQRLEILKYIDIIRLSKDKEFLFEFFVFTEFLNLYEHLCDVCFIGTMRVKNSKHTQLGKIFYCTNKSCRKEQGFFKKTWFWNKKLDKLFICLASFVSKRNIASVCRDTGLTEKTVTEYYKKFRITCADYVDNNPVFLGGTTPCEIDETHLFTRKYHRGDVLASEQIWVFGIFERETKRVFLKTVARRDSETLCNLLESNVMPGTTIYSDCWRGYSLIRERFNVLSVNHKINFVDSINREIHTQNIERLWRSVKEGMFGVSINNYDLHLKEFIFRRNYFTNSFGNNIVKLIKLL